jgi:hypothetical protein
LPGTELEVKPLDEASPHFWYYTNNPQYHAYSHPEIPRHEEIIAARDRWVARNPRLTIVAMHLASLEYDVDEVGKRLDDARNDKWQLPYSSLAISVRVMSSDFVRMNVRPKPDSDPFFIVSRRPIAVNFLREAMIAWEAVVSPQTRGRVLADAVDDLH